MKRTLLVVAGDLHVNGTVALSPDKYTLDDGQMFYPSKPQKWINRKWAEFWQHAEQVKEQHGAEIVTLITGEAADINKHPSSQYVTNHSGDAVGMAVKVLEPAKRLSDRIYVVRGSEAHVGLSGGLDEAVARAIGAVPDANGRYSRFAFRGVIGGLKVDAQHHPGTSYGRPWTRGADANRLAQIVIDQYVRGKQLPPDLVIRGHTHRPSDSYDNHVTRAITLPSWKLTDSYGYRLGGNPLPIGGLQLLLRNGKILQEWKHYHDWPLEPWRKA